MPRRTDPATVVPTDAGPANRPANRLREAVVDSIHSISTRHNDRNWILACRQSIVDGNQFRYKEKLSAFVSEVLGDLARTVASVFPELADRSPEDILLSFHVSSVEMRKWFRVLHRTGAWNATRFRDGEVKVFEDIYNWDMRFGHILTDPQMPENLDATFGIDKLTGAPFSLFHRTTDPQLDARFQITRATWRKSFELVGSPIFSPLVEHELDKCFDVDAVSERLCKLRHMLPEHARQLATGLQEIEQEVRRGLAFSGQASFPVVARSFLLSFFYTVGRCNARRFERIVASSIIPVCSRTNGIRPLKTGSLAIVVSGPTLRSVRIPGLAVESIRPAADALAQAIVELEHRALFERLHDGVLSITEEDTIRQACEVDYVPEGQDGEVGLEQLFRLCRPLHEAIGHRLISRHLPGDSGATAKNECSATVPGRKVHLPAGLRTDVTIEKMLGSCGIVGASRSYQRLILDLAAAVESDDLSETRVVFLDSEPGCGKEMLAKLLHLFSARAHLDRATKIAKVKKKVNERFADAFGVEPPSPPVTEETTPASLKAIARISCQDQEPDVKALPVFCACLEGTDSSSVESARLFNYFTLNLATLTDSSRFSLELFGNFKEENVGRAGRCLLGHGFSGTVFLDEFNTLPVKDSANVFLRLLEKPCEMEIEGRLQGPLVGTNILFIFASNKSREELIEDGYNDAVVYRVTKTRVRVPPLRERPADIAVFVNSMVRTFNKRRMEAGKQAEQIRRIDIKAMRLLCELRWADNYRGIQGLMDDVLGDRIQRQVVEGELSFEEILKGLRRREAFQAAVSQGLSARRIGNR